MSETKKTYTVIKKLDQDKQIVYAEIYAPYTLDAHGDMMLPEDIEKMAHNFMLKPNLKETIDTNHDNVWNHSYPIESFVARKGDPDFTEGAWVIGVKVEDLAVWDKVKKGVLAGFSMEVLAKMYPAVVEVDLAPSVLSKTEEADGHTHLFFLEVDETGRVIGGSTSKDYGHSHMIVGGTRTEEAFGHRHRFSLQ